jgi:hypothetical protein
LGSEASEARTRERVHDRGELPHDGLLDDLTRGGRECVIAPSDDDIHHRIAVLAAAGIDLVDSNGMELLNVRIAELHCPQVFDEVVDVTNLIDAVTRFQVWLLFGRAKQR